MLKFLLPLLFFSSAFAIDNSPEFVRGYLYSKIEDFFPNTDIEFEVHEDQIIIYKWPETDFNGDQLKSFIESCTNYTVIFDSLYTPIQPLTIEACENEPPYEETNFLPELNLFFPTLLAQPHILGYSAGWRSYDKVFHRSCLPISIGDQFSLYQFKTVSYGHLYFGIEACVWAIFEGRTKSLSLINADYFIGLPLTYINNRFSAKLRFFHESSHLGDEFLLENRNIERLNPSMEVIDLSLAYDFSENLTGFLGYGYVIRSDDSYKVKPNNIFYGFNYFMDCFKVNFFNGIGTPYIAGYFTNYENHNWALDSTLAIGYQWDKLYGHKLRIYLEAHNGFSPDGQFSKEKTQYLSLKILYGY